MERGKHYFMAIPRLRARRAQEKLRRLLVSAYIRRMHGGGAHLNRRRLPPMVRWLACAALLLASGTASALGLGEVRVLSRPGQPLLAEIPIISSDPAELEELRVGLASPEVFERVGLSRVQGLVQELDFAVAVSSDGSPVIRVTSHTPVESSAVNFLVEVDWGQGRLVREYSVLVGAPGVLAAAPPPPVQAPRAAPSDAIVRSPEPSTPAPEPEPRPVPAQPPVARAAATEADAGQVTVRAGQTLSQLARQLAPSVGLNQAMQALLQANPNAFIRGNINLLKQGAVLRAPSASELAQVDASQAADFVHRQMAEWRQSRSLPKPASGPAVAPPPSVARAAERAAPRVAEARLQIAPPVAKGGGQVGTTTGIQAGGEGEMLAEQQLQQTREDLAARDAEVQELRSQVAELEKIKQQQEKLIQMKDSDLAAAQQKLAGQQGGAGTPAWVWGGLALLIAGLVAAWLLGRRRIAAAPVRNAPKSRLDSAALAAAVPQAARADAEAEVPAVLEETADEIAELEAWSHRQGDASLNVALSNPAPAGRERLELAVAYLDLGDVETARDLLNEVMAGDDAAARQEAAQLLREL